MSRRPATSDDLPALAALDVDLFGAHAWSTTSWADELAQVPATRHVEVVTDDEVLLAYVVVMLVGDVADLQRIAVAPAARRSGLGRTLLAAALAVARERGCGRMLLEVAAGNEAAIALYLAAGFTQVHRREGYYGPGLDALVLHRDC